MGYPTRIYYTEADKALMWDRWQKGESLNEIGRYFGRSHTSIRNILSQTGGIRPPARRRSLRSLSLSEREEISRGIVAGRSIRSIATELGRAASTISREIRRRNAADGPYRDLGRQHRLEGFDTWCAKQKGRIYVEGIGAGFDRCKRLRRSKDAGKGFQAPRSGDFDHIGVGIGHYGKASPGIDKISDLVDAGDRTAADLGSPVQRL